MKQYYKAYQFLMKSYVSYLIKEWTQHFHTLYIVTVSQDQQRL